MSQLLIVCEYPTLLGGERSMLATLPSVQAGGFEPLVAAPASGPLGDALQRDGIAHFPWNTMDHLGQRRPLDSLRGDLARIISEVQPDLVHANSLSTSRVVGPTTADAKVPSVGHLRDIISLSQQAIDDLNCHDRLISVSRATRDYHVQQGVSSTKCHIMQNGIDLEEFQPRPATRYLHEELALPPSARLIAVVGQLGLRKGTDVALTAAWMMSHDVPDAHWLIVGERTSQKQESRDFETMLHELADEQPLAGHVHFLGTRDDMPQILNECVLLVHAARQEPLGRVLLEAAATGLAVVATDVGGTREIFPPSTDSAVLVDADDRSALAEAVASLLDDEERRAKLGQAAHRRVVEAFDARLVGDRLVEHYRDVLGA